jgi:dihydrofolate reductase
MGRLSVVEFVTLDGVMQAPARPDEDTRDGFTLGGWAVPFADQVMGETMGARMSGDGGAFLLGRRTYLDFAAVWSGQSGNPSADVLNARHKYVVSSTLEEPLPWAGSSLVGGDVADAVAELKEDRDLGVLGSGELVRTLLAHGLVDELLLSIYPIVLGTGRRLFADDGTSATFRVVDSVTTTTGVVIATYRPA